ncbi:MAG: DUF1947 domain-containing protein [archaeon]
MKRYLKNKEIRELSEEVEKSYNLDLVDKKDKVLLVDEKLFFVNDKLMFFFHEKKAVPTLRLLLKNNFLKKITVDMGAVRFVAGGADIMRPGIVEIEDGIARDNAVSIIDIKNKKPLAIGIALHSTEELRLLTSGKVIRNIHYVGDDIWKCEE